MVGSSACSDGRRQPRRTPRPPRRSRARWPAIALVIATTIDVSAGVREAVDRDRAVALDEVVAGEGRVVEAGALEEHVDGALLGQRLLRLGVRRVRAAPAGGEDRRQRARQRGRSQKRKGLSRESTCEAPVGRRARLDALAPHQNILLEVLGQLAGLGVTEEYRARPERARRVRAGDARAASAPLRPLPAPASAQPVGQGGHGQPVAPAAPDAM